ncbi:manganese/zinc/iron transport system substrate-binding protein [Geomicrobium halophilum]|uniref:Manganese/zinc/iron transport system substrate-binding protein n=1 Tax=Geomicrobium halophilum TaxID=549000 RepID=A0A841PWW4_9BACL|nr:zinc ABC transporter substrate-binding protein [Geomicrobium halophilum]MBB6448395.1 manganese/zinc/iron transport system substrate-binding protein [Geomicrobium halophilum]
MKRSAIFLSTVITSIGLLVACNDEETETATIEDGDVVQVTTTTSQIHDIVENVGGERVESTPLMGPGVDPHVYQASQGDIQLLNEADILFYNGLNLEANMVDMMDDLGTEKPVYALGESIPDTELKEDEEEAGKPDPHIWFDIDLWSHAVEEVRDGLIALDPDHESEYTENADEYLDELAELQEWANQEVEKVDEESRVLVTAHDAFQYFGDTMGFEVLGLQGLSTDAEYGLNDVQQIIDVMIEQDVGAIFAETSVSDSSVQAVIEGAGQRGHEVEHGGELYSDAMGEPGTEEGTYIGMYRSNVNQIVDALQ